MRAVICALCVGHIRATDRTSIAVAHAARYTACSLAGRVVRILAVTLHAGGVVVCGTKHALRGRLAGLTCLQTCIAGSERVAVTNSVSAFLQSLAPTIRNTLGAHALRAFGHTTFSDKASGRLTLTLRLGQALQLSVCLTRGLQTDAARWLESRNTRLDAIIVSGVETARTSAGARRRAGRGRDKGLTSLAEALQPRVVRRKGRHLASLHKGDNIRMTKHAFENNRAFIGALRHKEAHKLRG
mmetsp:Transcript_62654/g.110585  ORF Transcript_62654/g.110585 Transcript_62654/m.110585 type:complete len:242 (+) Transcript_62654:549-1274(+)